MTLYFIIAVAAWFVPLGMILRATELTVLSKGITHQRKKVPQVVQAAGDIGVSKSIAQMTSHDCKSWSQHIFFFGSLPWIGISLPKHFRYVWRLTRRR